MSIPPSLHRCKKCGAETTAYAAERLCVACMLETGLAEQVEDGRQKTENGPAPAPDRPLLTFGDYELLEEIARGGMGVVYRARQVSLHRTVAIKMVLAGKLANASELQRFRAEAETAARLQHPNIVAIHEVGQYESQPFFSMDYVEGRSLADLARNEPMTGRRAGGYLKTIAEAVQYAHSQGILHRDLKPSNILVDQFDQPRITDFGLAKRLDAEAHLTITGQMLGSPSFMPPEQASGDRRAAGPASDVYSLGAILYQLLTGRPPFVAGTIPETLRLVAETEPVSPRLLLPSVPRDLETICLKCLQKEPRRRYPTAQEFADDLGRYLLNEPIRARPVSRAERAWRWCGRNRALAGALAVAVTLLLVVGIGSPIAAYRINRARQQALANEAKARTQATRSQQVAQFLQDMLRGVGPSKAKGRDTKMLREILDQA